MFIKRTLLIEETYQAFVKLVLHNLKLVVLFHLICLIVSHPKSIKKMKIHSVYLEINTLLDFFEQPKVFRKRHINNQKLHIDDYSRPS